MSTASSSTGPSSPHISVIFPCHNEAENVAAVIADAREHASTFGDYELIVVDDGSVDGTAERAREVAEGDERVRVEQHATNQGYGHALRTGFTAARAPLVCYVDGDGQFSLADLPPWWTHWARTASSWATASSGPIRPIARSTPGFGGWSCGS